MGNKMFIFCIVDNGNGVLVGRIRVVTHRITDAELTFNKPLSYYMVSLA